MRLQATAIEKMLSDELRSVVRIVGAPTRIAKGIENRNYRISAEVCGAIQHFILRCPPEVIPQWRRADGLYDLHREYQVLRELEDFSVGAPRALVYDSGQRLGVPCFLMEELPGQSLTATAIGSTISVEAVADRFEAICKVNWERSDWLTQQLPRWSYERSMAFLDRMIAADSRDHVFDETWRWLRENIPAGASWVFCHGDLNLENFLANSGRITGIVDWEFACLRPDPLEELSFYPWLYGEALARAVGEAVCEKLGRPAKDIRWFMVRSWLGFAYGDTTHPDFPARRKRLATLVVQSK